MTFARKINRIPGFYTIFARKIPEFYVIIAQKYFSRFFFGGGTCPPYPPGPVSYAYELLLRLPGGIAIGRVCCWVCSFVLSLVSWLVRYVRADFSQRKSPIFMRFGTVVQHLRQLSLLTFERSQFKVQGQNGPTELVIARTSCKMSSPNLTVGHIDVKTFFCFFLLKFKNMFF